MTKDPGFVKVAEFFAPAAINCVDIGTYSLQVLATGNADRDVSLFSIRGSSPIMTLTGHTSPVEAVKFQDSEECLLAGSLGGVIKVWDLRAQKFKCSLKGHCGPVTCLDTYGHQYVASGSVDSSVKIWDLRMEGGCYTYNGHGKTVNSVQFSPNGSWLVSGSSDGTVKLWDLLGGKLIHDFTACRSGVIDSVFHPFELLMAIAGNDRSVRFFDLEHFCEISSYQLTIGASSGVISLKFHNSGQCLYSLSTSHLTVHGWEPAYIWDQVPKNKNSGPSGLWANSKQLAWFGGQSPQNPHLAVVNVMENNLGIFSIDPASLRPFASPSEKVDVHMRMNGDGAPHRASPSSRRSFSDDRAAGVDLHLHLKLNEPAISEASDYPVVDNDQVVSNSELERNAVFFPNHALSRSPQLNHKVMPAGLNHQTHSGVASPSRLPISRRSSGSPQRQKVAMARLASGEPGIGAASPQPIGHSTPVDFVGPPTTAAGTSEKLFFRKSNVKGFAQRDNASPRTRYVAAVAPQRAHCTSSTQTTPKTTPESSPKDLPASPAECPDFSYMPECLPSSAFGFISLNDVSSTGTSDVVGGGAGRSWGQLSNSHTHTSSVAFEDDVVGFIRKGNVSVANTLMQRLKLFQNTMLSLRRDGTRAALDYAMMSGNEHFELEFLRTLTLRRAFWNLDVCSLALPRVRQFLIHHNSDHHTDIAIACLRIVLRDFSTVIRNGFRSAPSIGVDIVQEERRRKCETCARELSAIKAWIVTEGSRRKNVFIDEVALLMKGFD